ncbi:hypothetical protein V1508DRAFT_417834 [Lipomyces doorenjongii]|uniref:uncharacterized protein n=1 Tax=Lipomyces doorenjongii TaxID=383834 RepID=UPI0034CE14A2
MYSFMQLMIFAVGIMSCPCLHYDSSIIWKTMEYYIYMLPSFWYIACYLFIVDLVYNEGGICHR